MGLNLAGKEKRWPPVSVYRVTGKATVLIIAGYAVAGGIAEVSVCR